MFHKIILGVILFFVFQAIHAQTGFYFLCGPDEDGCPEGDEHYCACIPESVLPEQPYCLDFDHMTCAPLAKKPGCDNSLIFRDQQSCLATIFQSEPEPPCVKVKQEFCETHVGYMCDESGDPNSCKKHMQ